MEKRQTNIWSSYYNPFQDFKMLAWYDHFKAIKTGHFLPPVNVALDINSGTSKIKLCGPNFRCKMCMSDIIDDETPHVLDREILFSIPQFFNEWGVKSICLGGDSSDWTTYNQDDSIKFLRLCKQYNIQVGVVSNGAWYGEDLIEETARNCEWSGWSVNSYSAENHKVITGSETWEKVIGNMTKMAAYAKKKHFDHTTCYKFLIMPENFEHIYEAVQVAKDAGCRHVQIRPTELPVEEALKIIPEVVEQQMRKSLELEVPGQFEVFGIREKFNRDFTKITMERCIATPLGSTWLADGSIVLCPDRRWSAHKPGYSWCNYVKEGLEAVRRKWGGPEHLEAIRLVNEDIHNCIRCSSIKFHDIYENTVASDPMNITLI
jgi:pyruvate-formate lyase-activating enzyme